jgi:NADH-quinone oxidoreductase subunit G
LPAALDALVTGDFATFDRQESICLEGVWAKLKGAKRPVLAGGADLLGPEGVEALLRTVGELSTAQRPCGAAVLLAGPNSFGGALLAGDGPDFDVLLDGILAGEIKALVCLETDPFRDHPDPARARTALSRLELLVVLDCVSSEAVQRADIFLPTTVPAEGAGTFVNFEGRLLPFASAFAPGVPIRETGGGDHPPRSFTGGTPGDQPHPSRKDSLPGIIQRAGKPLQRSKVDHQISIAQMCHFVRVTEQAVTRNVGHRMNTSGPRQP